MTDETRFPNLLSPLRVGPRTLRNRVLVTAHVARIADGGAPGDRYIAYHRAKARGGVALRPGEFKISSNLGSVWDVL